MAQSVITMSKLAHQFFFGIVRQVGEASFNQWIETNSSEIRKRKKKSKNMWMDTFHAPSGSLILGKSVFR